jgi:PST family polysaccharide transporter
MTPTANKQQAVRAGPMVQGLSVNYAGFAARYLISFVSLPFLSRVLGPSSFGEYVMAISVATMVSLVVEYGFGVSALREIALAETTAGRLAVLGRVTAAKLALIVVVAVGFVVYLHVADQAPGRGIDPRLVFALGALQGLNLAWYFQGLGQPLIAVLLDASAQLGWVVASVCLVRSSSDAAVVIATQLVAAAAAAAVGHRLAFKALPHWGAALKAVPRELRSGSAFFVMRLGTAGFTTLSALIVGSMAGAAEAGYYNAAERLIGTIIAAFNPASQVLLPHLVKRFAHTGEAAMFESARRIGLTLVSFSVVGVLAVWLTAPLVIHILSGARYDPSIGVLRILSLTLPFVAMSQALGMYLALPLRREKCFTASVLLAGAVNICLAAVLAPWFGALGMGFCRVTAEATIVIGLLVGLGRGGDLSRFFKRSAPV